MGLSDIAAGIEVTAEQDDRGVAWVDATGGDLASALAPVESDLPCSSERAAALVEAYADGQSVGGAARAVGLAPTTGAKVLHLLGEPVSPLTPLDREVVEDYLAARVSRTDAVALVGSEAEFVLGLYVATHDPLPAGREAVAGHLAVDDVDPLEAHEADDLL